MLPPLEVHAPTWPPKPPRWVQDRRVAPPASDILSGDSGYEKERSQHKCGQIPGELGTLSPKIEGLRDGETESR